MNRRSLTLILVSPLVLRIFFFTAYSQTTLPLTVFPGKVAAGITSTSIPSNSVSHLGTRGGDLWLGTGKGLAKSVDGGRTFTSYRYVPQFPRPGIFALDTRGFTIWASTGYSKEIDGGTVQAGAGYAYSTDNGGTWNSAGQPLDQRTDSLVSYGANTVKFIPIIVPEQNVTFDLSLTDSAVWVASWSSGLRRSTDAGKTWRRTVLPSRTLNSIAPTDTLTNYLIDPRLDNNFLMFSVFAESDRSIWAGSAGGINRSTDGGLSWTKFTVDNQTSHILGNWVIAIKGQTLGTRRRIWATNWPADGQTEQYAVCATDDSGKTWKNFLPGVKAYDFAFRDSITYIATENGLYRTSDGGASWFRSGSLVDASTGAVITGSTVYAVATIGDTVFAGTPEGLLRSTDNSTHPLGERWEILRTSQPVSSPTSTYSYPNPFSPKQEAVRIHYSTGGVTASVTIEVFDFGMNRLRTVLRDARRDGAPEHDELWDGRDDTGSILPNGVYFYRVTTGNGDPAWGKVMVIQ